MNAAKNLWKLRTLETKLRQREEQLNNIRQAAIAAGATGFDPVPVQGTAEGGRVERIVLRYLELEREIQDERLALEEQRNRIIGQIHTLTNERYVIVLYKYFVENKSYEEISGETNYSYDYVKSLRKKGTRVFTELFSKPEEDEEATE